MDEPTPTENPFAGLPYLGATRAARLQELGIRDRDALRALPEEELAKVGFMGLTNARRIHEALDGAEVKPRGRARRRAAAAPPPAEEAPAARRGRRPRQAIDVGGDGASVNAAIRSAIPVELEPVTVVSATTTGVEQVEGAAPSPDGADFAAAIAVRQAELPEAVDALVNAIRDAALAPAFRKQTARFLQTAAQLEERQPHLSESQRRRAANLMNRAQADLRDALNRRRFSCEEQRDLAAQLRRRRRRLEALLTSGDGGSD